MKTDTPRPILLKDYRPPNFLVDTAALDVSLHPSHTRVHSRLKVKPNPAFADALGPLQLDGESLTLEHLRLNGRKLLRRDYVLSASQLTIADVPQQPFKLDITTTCNPEANKALQGLYLSRGIYCTQCEAQGFRRITFFPDRPDVLTKYTVRIEAARNEAPVLLANGNPLERGTLNGGSRHYAVWRDPYPKPCYLFALVGGNLTPFLSTFTTKSGRNVDLAIFVEPGKEDRCAWAMECLKRSMRWDEERYNREYDLDVYNIVAVSDFNMGAMENKGLNIFNDRLILASTETATDSNFADIERVIAHEYFHNWTGNRITCRDWFQLCLKEGLTVFRDQEFSADQRSHTVQRIRDVRHLKARQFPEDSGPLAHPVRPDRYIEINNFYTPTVYEKGAELVRMIETIVGRDGFGKGMELYFKRHDGQAATVEDFITCFEDATGNDLSQFLIWYSQAGTPNLICELKYDKRAKTADLTITQALPQTPGEVKKKSLHIPLRLGLLGGNGQDLPLRLSPGKDIASGVLNVTKRSETFRFVDVPSRPVPSLLRGFSAPVNLTMDLNARDLEFLMANDSDLYNRWQAAQEYAMRALLAAVRALRAGKRPEPPTALAAALGNTLRCEELEPAYRAQFLALPGESELARIIGRDVDPAAIHRARDAFKRAIGIMLGDELIEAYHSNEVKGLYSPSAEHAGRRALRGAALALLTARGYAQDIARTAEHFAKAKSCTDQTLGLALLTDVRGSERRKAFDSFYERWKDDHLVIDHWFTYQAISSLPSSLMTVKRLMRHPLFSLHNPNKVRSLIGSFAAANPLNFNRPDGKGYEFVTAIVLEIDAFNPQVAARLLGSFHSWRALEPVRRRVAKAALQRVARQKRLSRDTFEITAKMLE
jgi:aminopeptidase N